MNNMQSWQTKKRLWLCIAGMVFVSVLSCGGCNREPTKLPAKQLSGDRENANDDQRPTSAELRVLIDGAKEAVELGHLDDAIEKYASVLRQAKSVSVSPDYANALNSEVFHLRGQAFLNKGFPQIAIEDFDESIRLGEDELNAKTYFLRARAEAELERWSLVVSDCGRSIRLYPKNGEAFLVRGRALESMGQFSRAEESLLEAQRLGVVFQTTLKPSFESSPSALAQAKLSMEADNPGVACEILKKAIQDGDHSWETSGLLALAQFQLQDFYRANIASTRAIELNPQYAEGYRVRGLSNLQRGSFDQAITDLNAAIVLDASLEEALKPGLSEARRRGGIDPLVRTSVTNRIRKLVGVESKVESRPDQSEQWLLELIEQRRSSDQIDQLKTLLAATPVAEFDSLDWLADYLMLDYRVPAVKEMRNYLNRNSPDVSAIEIRLWESVKSRSAAAGAGVNVFSDLAAYAIEYGRLDLLQKSIDAEICRIKFGHLYQAIGNDRSDCLRMILPHVNLLGRETPGLLRYCIENNRRDQAMLIIDRYEESLTWDVIHFLGMAE